MTRMTRRYLIFILDPNLGVTGGFSNSRSAVGMDRKWHDKRRRVRNRVPILRGDGGWTDKIGKGRVAGHDGIDGMWRVA